MASSRNRSPSMWGFPYREKPRLLHVFIGVGVSAFSLALLWLNFPNLLSNLITQVLLAGHISVEKSLNSEAPLLVVKLLDGSKLDLTLTWQRSGLASITIFGLLFLSLMFPLKGSIWRKTAWLELGFIIGLTWSFIRLSIAVLVAYHFGASAFTVTEFLTGPFTDFFWVVSVWSLGLSALISTKDKKEELK